jgi:hypothetical protein
MRWQRFEAEILFLSPDQAPRGIEPYPARKKSFDVAKLHYIFSYAFETYPRRQQHVCTPRNACG